MWLRGETLSDEGPGREGRAGETLVVACVVMITPALPVTRPYRTLATGCPSVVPRGHQRHPQGGVGSPWGRRVTDSSGEKGSGSPWQCTLGACSKGSAGEIPSLNPTPPRSGVLSLGTLETLARALPPKRRGQPAHTLSWAPPQAPRSCCPSSRTLCQPFQPLPGLGRRGLAS